MARRNKRRERRIATERVQRLLDLAEAAALAGHQGDADRYAALAWRVQGKYTLSPSPRLKAATCRACKAFLLPSVSSRTRVRGGKLTTTCLACGTARRRPLRGRRGAGAERGSNEATR